MVSETIGVGAIEKKNWLTELSQAIKNWRLNRQKPELVSSIAVGAESSENHC